MSTSRLAVLRRQLLVAPWFLAAFSVLALGACGDETTDPSVIVTSIAVTPRVTDLRVGATQQLAAQPLDAKGAPVSGSVVWSSSDPTVASVSSSGLVTALKAGSTSVFASVGNVSGFAAIVTIVPVSTIVLTPLTGVLPPGQTVLLSVATNDASGNPLVGRPITFTSSAPTVATVSATGLLTGVVNGTTTITATSEGKSAQVTVTVAPLAPVATVSVTPVASTVATAGTLQLTATLRDADGVALSGRTIVWTTSAGTVATVSATGLVTVLTPGTVTITATSEGRSGTASINELVNGTSYIIAGPLNSSYNFFINVPTGATRLTVTLRGAAGQDPDISIFRPGVAAAACISETDGPNETCDITATVTPGLWRINVLGFTVYSNVTLRAVILP